MSDESRPVHTPVELTARLFRSGWNTLLTIYYASSPSWRVLKSGALLFFGFFLWAGSNILLSYRSDWTFLTYPMAYGFVLVFYGPFHHLAVIPLALAWRRRGGTYTRVGRRLPNAGLALFLTAVVVLGTFPAAAGPMTYDFDATLEGAGADVNPDLLCTKSTNGTATEIHCHLTTAEGIDTVTVESGGKRVAVDRNPPFEFTIRESDLQEVVGQKQFQVVLRDADGDVIRRYTRTLSMIEAAD